MSDAIISDAMDFLLSLDETPDLTKLDEHVDKMLKDLDGQERTNPLLSHMYSELYENCSGLGYPEDKLNQLLALSKRLYPKDETTPIVPAPKKEGIYVIRQRLRGASEQQRTGFRKLWDATPSAKRGALLEKMAKIECRETLEHFLEHGPDFLSSLNEHERWAMVSLLADINCNLTLRKILQYGRQHCTNGGRAMFMGLLATYAIYLKDERASADVIEYIHDEVRRKD